MKLLFQAWHANQPFDLAVAAGIALGVMLAFAALRFGATRALKALAARTSAVVFEIAVDVAGATKLWLLLPVALYAGASAIELPGRIERLIDVAALVALLLQAAILANRFILSWLQRKVARQRVVDGGVVTALELIGFAARAVVWGLTGLFILGHLGFDVTALVAGLGIGGSRLRWRCRTSSATCSRRFPSCSTSRSWSAISSWWTTCAARSSASASRPPACAASTASCWCSRTPIC